MTQTRIDRALAASRAVVRRARRGETDEDAALAVALALGRLCRRLPPSRARDVLGVAATSYEAGRGSAS